MSRPSRLLLNRKLDFTLLVIQASLIAPPALSTCSLARSAVPPSALTLSLFSTRRTPSVLRARRSASSLAASLPARPSRVTTPSRLVTLMSSPSVLRFHNSFDFTVAVVVASLKRLEKLRSPSAARLRSEEHTSELQSRPHLVCRLLLEKKKKQT